jgi:hypothetical protein
LLEQLHQHKNKLELWFAFFFCACSNPISNIYIHVVGLHFQLCAALVCSFHALTILSWLHMLWSF